MTGGGSQIEVGRISVLWRSRRIMLTPAELRIVRLLSESPGACLTRNTISLAAAVSIGSLHVFVCHINRKFREADPSLRRVIFSKPGRCSSGWVWCPQ